MTKLQSAVQIDNNAGSKMLHDKDDQQTNGVKESMPAVILNGSQSLTHDDSDSNTESDYCAEDEPLGYQHFLYDVNIEYSPGGHLPLQVDHKHCFKLKCLPYMVECNRGYTSSNDTTNCDEEDRLASESVPQARQLVDVKKATCAFLGNSDYVPSAKFNRRRVVLELVSAKLSHPIIYNVPTKFTHLVSIAEVNSSTATQDSASIENSNGPSKNHPIAPPSPSSKKFVNYTILLKTTPGLDKHPAVIERRFSDFLALYQGLKGQQNYSKTVDKHVSFPKKVYMGNFTLLKIAERSVEFTRLLNLCISRNELLWSTPFVSFLVDKEIKEAHRLSMFGDPEDVQAILETTYYIEEKLYIHDQLLSWKNESSSGASDLLHDNNESYSSTLPICISPSNHSSVDDLISQENINTYSHGSNPSTSDTTNDDSGIVSQDKASLSSINQRILVTFCMLFVVYYRNDTHQELKKLIRKFSLLISSQEFIDSILDTRHYNSLRGCLVYLMNMNREGLIDEHLRSCFKRKLEDIDGAHTDLNESSSDSNNSSFRSISDKSSRSNRLTNRDLTSLLRDRNFCSFQDARQTR